LDADANSSGTCFNIQHNVGTNIMRIYDNTAWYWDTPQSTASNHNELQINTSDNKITYLSSLRSHKFNISPLEDVSWIHRLKPSVYQGKTMNHDTNTREEINAVKFDYGLIFDEVEPVNKNLCGYDKDDKPTVVIYTSLIVPMLKEIQNLRKELEQLKSEK
jgi:hypothetical protein